MNRPANRPTCRHGKPIGGMGNCKECYAEEIEIKKEIAPLVDEFWENRGQRDLRHLMFRAYLMGMKRKST